jgi:hypothetical protein
VAPRVLFAFVRFVRTLADDFFSPFCMLRTIALLRLLVCLFIFASLELLDGDIRSKDGNGSGSDRVESPYTQNRNPNLKPEPDPNPDSGENPSPKPKPADTRNPTD